MLGIIIALIGAFIGFRTATKRGGDGKDKALYTAVYALAFAMIGLFVGVIFDRLT